MFLNTDWLVLAKSSTLDGYDAIFGMPGQVTMASYVSVLQSRSGTLLTIMRVNTGIFDDRGTCIQVSRLYRP